MTLYQLIEALQAKATLLGNVEALAVDANGARPIFDVYDAEDEGGEAGRRYVAIALTGDDSPSNGATFQ